MSVEAESPIQVITYREKNPKTGIIEEIISHGVNLYTSKIVTMEQVSVTKVNYLLRDPELGWVLKGN